MHIYSAHGFIVHIEVDKREKWDGEKGKSLGQSNDTFSLLVLPDNDINESCFGSGSIDYGRM